MEKYHCARVYPNGDCVETVRDKAGMESWRDYNMKARGGNSLFINGVFIEGTGTLGLEFTEHIALELKTELDAKLKLPASEIKERDDWSGPMRAMNFKFTGYGEDPETCRFRKLVNKIREDLQNAT